jgi:protein-disulfide isomerase
MEPEIKETHTKEGSSAYLLPGSILIAGIMISFSIIYLVGNQKAGNLAPKGGQVANVNDTPADVAKALQLTSQDVVLGDPKAPVTVIEYGDYQCPFCAQFFKTIEPRARDKYVKTGQVKMVFRNFQFLGPESTAAGEAALCAADQHQSWAYHDALYTAEATDAKENNGNLNRALFIKIAGDLKLDATAFASCIDSHKYREQVAADEVAAQDAGVNSTPTTFVGDKKLDGAVSFSEFSSAVEEALKKNK